MNTNTPAGENANDQNANASNPSQREASTASTTPGKMNVPGGDKDEDQNDNEESNLDEEEEEESEEERKGDAPSIPGEENLGATPGTL